MSNTRRDVERLEEALLQAGRSIAPRPPRGAWQANVMRAVRQAGPIPGADADDSTLWGLMWKVAIPAAACAAVLFVVVQVSGITDHDVAQDVEMNNTVEYTLASVF